jgi:DNA-nicking Smr family endonuclease
VASPSRSRTGGLTETDRADWDFVARQVTPLSGRTPNPAAPPPPNPVTPAARPRPQPLPAARPALAAVAIGAEPAGLDRASWQRFRGGKLAVTRRLDLHGMTTQRAFHALLAFLRAAHADRLRCVEVITGRGSSETGGSIRRELPLWLNLPDVRPLILAASHPHAANPGSVRLLLRRPR